MLTENQKLETLAKKLGIPTLYFKREDHHPLFSHKGRSIPKMIDHYIAKGKNNFVISSSGNSALSGAIYIKNLNKKMGLGIKLKIFIGPNISQNKEHKLLDLADSDIEIEKTNRPKQSALKKSAEGFQILRQSTDNLALVGYKELADEINNIENLEAIFVPTSSGTLAQGLAENLDEKIKIFIVQTPKCCPIAKVFDNNFETGNSSADAIVDQVAFRKKALIKILNKNAGGGFVADDDLISEAIKLFKTETNETLSGNSALAFAGVLKAIKTGFKPKGAVLCIVGGE